MPALRSPPGTLSVPVEPVNGCEETGPTVGAEWGEAPGALALPRVKLPVDETVTEPTANWFNPATDVKRAVPLTTRLPSPVTTPVKVTVTPASMIVPPRAL